MARHSLHTWIALLSESGFHLSLEGGSVESVEAAARRLDAPLDEDDRATLEQLVDYFLQPPDQRIRFSVTIFHHPMIVIPHRSLINSKGGVSLGAETIRLPPWGRMEEDLESSYKQAVVPIDWVSEDGSNATLSAWNGWLSKLIREIADLIWPVYDPISGTWERSYCKNLIDADFELLRDLRANLDLPITARYPTTVFHRTLFSEEDDGNILFCTGYKRYDPTLDPIVLEALPTVFNAGIANKVGTLDLNLKNVFQRPRPYQVALIERRKQYSYHWANTANTPSLVSGHALQAAIGGCTAYSALPIDEGSSEILQQFTADIGDRRVFAGVHYPSDSLASWYTAFRLIPRVFRGAKADQARDFLWDAIDKKSLVFDSIKAHAKDERSPYLKIVQAIRDVVMGTPAIE